MTEPAGSIDFADVALQIGEGLPRVHPIMLGAPQEAQATEQIGRFVRPGSLTREPTDTGFPGARSVA